MTDEAAEFVLGSLTGDFLRCRAVGRSHPGRDDYWDGNWLRCEIDAAAGAFSARVVADLRAEELKAFSEELKAFDERLEGEPHFSTMESWLSIKLTVNRLGQVEATCVLVDNPGVGNRLEFTLSFDQTFLAPASSALSELVARYPILGEAER